MNQNETPPYKKKKCDKVLSEPRCAVRILGRRYALIPTSYKYLEIGISVGAVSCVEFILNDNQGTQIILSETWESLMQKHVNIK
ncbi:hypothetical protein ACFW04_014118 [Cataglyphis niger]